MAAAGFGDSLDLVVALLAMFTGTLRGTSNAKSDFNLAHLL